MTDTTVRGGWLEWPLWDLRVLEPADGRAVAGALVAGVAFDVGVRSGVATIGGALSVLVAVGALVASRRLHSVGSRSCLAAAAVLGSFLALRASPWLLVLDLLGAASLLVLAGVVARERRGFDLPARLLASRAVVAVGHGFGAAAFLLGPVRRLVAVRRSSMRLAAVARGLALTVPLVLALGALLASADAVFASVVRVRVPASAEPLGHLALVLLGALGVGAVLRTASANARADLPPLERRLGTLEWTMALGAVVALLGVFAAAQLVTAAGGARHVLETQGLTYAEYARTGYMQLLAATALTGGAIVGLHAVAAMPDRRTRRRFVVLAEVAIALTGVVLAVSVRRLGLYEDAYGWTMLRVLAKASAAWLGLTLVLAAARLAGVERQRAWFVPAAIAAGVVTVVALNAVNPEAAVARHNLALTREIDAEYLAGELSDDAVPAIVAALPVVDADARARLLALLCVTTDQGDAGALSWNRAEAAADAARARVCPG